MSNPSFDDNNIRLKRMGVCWFVSYAFYEHKDESHMAWKNAGTLALRKSYYCNTRKHHHEWLEQVLKMNDAKLNLNTLHLTAAEVKSMVAQLLETI